MFLEQSLQAITWYLLTLIIGLVGYRIFLTAFNEKQLNKNNNEDLSNTLTGYILGRVFGLVIFSYIVWILSALSIIEFGATNAFIIFLFIAGIVLGSYYKELTKKNSLKGFSLLKLKIKKFSFKKFFGNEIIFYELLYLAFFVLYALYIMLDPKISGSEEYMNVGIFSSIAKNPHLPPKDIWLSGYTLNYYYFGHFVYALVHKLTNLFIQVPISITYNLTIISIMTNITLGAFYLAHKLTKKILFGFFMVFMLCFVTNYHFTHGMIFNPQGNVFDAFNLHSEIPGSYLSNISYLFFVGGIHAHFFSMPIFILLVGLFLHIYLKFYDESIVKNVTLKNLNLKNLFSMDSIKHTALFKFSFTQLVLICILFGSIYATNSWDFANFGLFMGLLFVLTFGLKRGLFNAFIISLISLVLYIPFYINIYAPIFGFELTAYHFTFSHYFMEYGHYILLTAVFFTLFISNRNRFKNVSEEKKPLIFSIICLVTAILLFAIPEVISLVDVYEDHRFNTTYKLWFQARFFMSLGLTYVLYFILLKIPSKKRLISLIVGVILFLTTPFLIVSINEKFKNPKFEYGFDGFSYLHEENPDFYNSINFINNNISPDSIFVTTPGVAYIDYESIISAYTGNPTVIGWTNHQLIWRNNMELVLTRNNDIRAIYLSNDKNEIMNLLSKYNASYVVISDIEVKHYGNDAGDTIKNSKDDFYLVFNSSSVSIYARNNN